MCLRSREVGLAKCNGGCLTRQGKPADDTLEEEFKNFDMASRFVEVFSPGVKSVLANQETMTQRMLVIVPLCLYQLRQRRDVLRVVENGYPDGMVMGGDSREAFEHFVAGDLKPTLLEVNVGQQGAPHRMCVQYSSDFGLLSSLNVEQRFGRALGLAVGDGGSIGTDPHEVGSS